MNLPMTNGVQKQKIETTEFKGLAHKPYCPDGMFYDVSNVNLYEYPLLQSRYDSVFTDGSYTRYTPYYVEKYLLMGTVPTHSRVGVEMWREQLRYYLTVYGKTYDETWDDTSPMRDVISYGNDIVIFPMARLFKWNPASMEFDMIKLEAEGVCGDWFNPCDRNGNLYTPTVSETEPETKTEGMVWCDTSDGGIVYKRWSVTYLRWDSIPKVYLKTWLTTTSGEIKEGDTVKIEATDEYSKELDGYHEIVKKDGNYIVITGMAAGPVNIYAKVSRKVPDMDHVIECNNRLWGCKYGIVDGEFINEIYCCKLGDPTNWRTYAGVSTDAWAASNGTDGPWTGAIAYKGSPWFFKERSATKIYISSTGAHQSVDYYIHGVEHDSWQSVVIVNDTIYYNGKDGVYMFDGSTPVKISTPLGDSPLYYARACTDGTRYHMVAENYGGNQRYFIYDTSNRTWTEYSLDLIGRGTNHEQRLIDIIALDGYVNLFISFGQPIIIDLKDDVKYKWRYDLKKKHKWHATSGIQYYFTPEKKYIGRYSFRVELDEGSTFELDIEYDSSGEWIHCGEIVGDRHGCYTLPVVPRRCDHLRYRISGKGHMILYSITRELEGGVTEK